MDLDSQRKGKSAVIKTSTRQVMEREKGRKREEMMIIKRERIVFI